MEENKEDALIRERDFAFKLGLFCGGLLFMVGAIVGNFIGFSLAQFVPL